MQRPTHHLAASGELPRTQDPRSLPAATFAPAIAVGASQPGGLAAWLPEGGHRGCFAVCTTSRAGEDLPGLGGRDSEPTVRTVRTPHSSLLAPVPGRGARSLAAAVGLREPLLALSFRTRPPLPASPRPFCIRPAPCALRAGCARADRPLSADRLLLIFHALSLLLAHAGFCRAGHPQIARHCMIKLP